MKRCPFTQAKFIKTAILPEDYPLLKNSSGELLPEVAVAGRSNVGKSSLLNHLFRSKDLVKTSATPGKTQALNFFVVNDLISFVDFPGYGYASVPHSLKKHWGPMTERYIRERSQLKLILFLIDVRRIPNEDDKKFFDWAVFHKKAIVLVITKIDKVKKTELAKNTKHILETFDALNLHYVHYTILDSRGRDLLIRIIHEAIEDESQTETSLHQEEELS